MNSRLFKQQKARPLVVIVRPPAGYATGNKPNIKGGLYLLPQLLPYLALAVEKAGAEPVVFDLECSGWALPRFMEELQRINPDMVCITATSLSFCYAEAISRKIRQLTDDIPIVMGGVHVTYEWQHILNKGLADAVVLGEGEASLGDLIACLRGRRVLTECRGVAFRRGLPQANPLTMGPRVDLASFGRPAYHRVNMNAYLTRVGKCSMEVIRGCPCGCGFCLNPRFYGQPLRFKPEDTVVDEMRYLIERWGFERFSIISPEFVADKDYTIRLCKKLRRLLDGTKATWACTTTAASLSHDVLEAMAQAHCRSIFIGFDTASGSTLQVVNKQINYSTIEELLADCSGLGIGILSSFIIGFPGETKDEAIQTIEWAKCLSDKFKFRRLQFNTFAPFPGTDLLQKLPQYSTRLMPVDYAYYAVVPVTSNAKLSYDTHLELWHSVWKTFFPVHYESYLEIENHALAGRNPKLDAFVEGKAQNPD